MTFHSWLKLPITFWCSFTQKCSRIFCEQDSALSFTSNSLQETHSDQQNRNLWPATAHTVPVVLPPHSSDFVVTGNGFDKQSMRHQNISNDEKMKMLHLQSHLSNLCCLYHKISRFTSQMIWWKPGNLSKPIKTYESKGSSKVQSQQEPWPGGVLPTQHLSNALTDASAKTTEIMDFKVGENGRCYLRNVKFENG